MAVPNSLNTHSNIKFLCSYGGKILPRYPDGKLRYHGGHTRVLSVHRSISFSELMSKLSEMSGASVVKLRCQLPMEDLDALISITSDEDLLNLIEEYDRAPLPPPAFLKIRAFISQPKSTKKEAYPPESSTSSSPKSSSPYSSPSPTPRFVVPAAASSYRCIRQIPASPPVSFPNYLGSSALGKMPQYGFYDHGNPSHIYLIHNGNHWQL